MRSASGLSFTLRRCLIASLSICALTSVVRVCAWCDVVCGVDEFGNRRRGTNGRYRARDPPRAATSVVTGLRVAVQTLECSRRAVQRTYHTHDRHAHLCVDNQHASRHHDDDDDDDGRRHRRRQCRRCAPRASPSAGVVTAGGAGDAAAKGQRTANSEHSQGERKGASRATNHRLDSIRIDSQPRAPPPSPLDF